MKITFTILSALIYTVALPFFYPWTGMSLQAQPDLVWAKQFMGGGTNNRGHAVALDKNGNSYTVGFYTGTMDFDPGPVTYNLTTLGSGIFLCKLNAAGDFVMAKQFTGTTSSDGGLPYAVSVSDNGDIYITGQFKGTVDFDPGAGTFNMTSMGANRLDGFVCKLDASGNFLWAVKIGNSDNDVANNLAIDKNGNVYVTGYFSDMVDFDPGPGIYNLNSVGTSSIFVLKLNTSGNFVWAKFMGDSIPPYGSSIGYSIALDGSGNVYTTGQFSSACDFDPGPGTYFLTPVVGGSNMFISKLDNNGNFVWAKNAGPIVPQTLNAGHSYIAIDGSKHVYIAGAFSGTVDFDPGAGVSNLTSTGSNDVYISKFDSSGNFVWAKKIGATTYATVPAIALDAKSNVYMTGLFKGTADFDPGFGTFNLTSKGSQDMYINMLSSSGNFICVGQIGGTNPSADQCGGWGITVDGNNTVYVTGQFLGNIDFDADTSASNIINGNAGHIFVGKYNPCSTSICPDMIGGTATPNYSIICPATTQALSADGTGGTLQWQKSSDNVSWSDVSGETNNNYTTPDGATLGGAGTKVYYRCLVKNAACHDVSSTTAIVDVSQPVITVTVARKTDVSLTLDWSPVGSGNYSITYDGASSGAGSGKTPPYTLSNLVPGGDYNITVTQTGLPCSASGTLTGVKTLCAMPTNVTVSSPGKKKLKVDWEGAAGNYRVYYRPTFIKSAYNTSDVTTAGTSGSVTINVRFNTSYEVYVVSKDCPTTGQFGQPSALYYGIVGASSPCTPAPTIHYVKSTCAGQIEVSMSGSPTGNYIVAVQRLTPTVTSMNLYPVSGSYFSVNVNSAGETFLVAAASKCITGTSDYIIYPGGITIKPLCNAIPNIVLSHPTCNGFTAAWNRDVCSENTINTYQVFMRRISPSPQLTWSSYQIAPPVLPITPFMTINWLNKGSVVQCYVRSNYVCSGYIIQGPPSTTESITTLSIGCREEEGMIQPEEPAAVITSADNSEAISLYPNPNGGQFRIDISRLSNEKTEVRIEMINILGQTVLTRISEVKDGFGNELITLPETVSAGTYFVRVTVGNNVYTTKASVSN